MNAFSFKERCLIGLTLFSMFFGAGNLIFPPFLGYLAGESTLSAMSGFAITAVAFPILGVIAVARSGGLETLAGRVHPVFAFIFTLLIYLSIGPCLAIPRTASTSFEMAVAPLFSGDAIFTGTVMGFEAATVAQAVYSVVFFTIAYLIALNPEKLTQRLGKILSPTLITLIVVLFIASIVHPLGDYAAVRAPYDAAPLFKGFIEGYQTMDTLAALNFGLIIAMNIKAFGIKDEKTVVSETVKAGLIAGLLLISIYSALAHIGAEAGGAGFSGENGAQILTAIATAQFGPLGLAFLGAIFFIACLNTCVGLLSCCSNYFKVTFPVMGYHGWLILFVLSSMVFSNAGLTMILKLSVPVLVGLYPLALVIIVLGLIHPLISGMKRVYPVTMLFTGIASVGQAMNFAGFPIPGLDPLLKAVPLSSIGLEWVIVAAVGLLIGAVISPRRTATN